jgi:16S rRNA (guanine(966)-N(2))-methyltransferase RsmD
MKLFSPKGQGSRPITDRVKESLFNVLGNFDLPGGAVVADLFCGVGSLGLETLSRGAEFVTFVEQDPKIIVTLERNIEKAGFIKESKVIRANAFKIGAPVGKKIEIRSSKFEIYGYDLVFVDPPYTNTRNVGVGSPLSGLLDLLQEQVDQSSHNSFGAIRAIWGHRATPVGDNGGNNFESRG